MSVDITARVRIARDPTAVAAYVTDPANDPQAPFPMRITYRFEPAADGGTDVSNHVRGGGPRLLAPLVRRNVQRDLERLRHRLEVAAGR
jgi:hypothetical protein